MADEVSHKNSRRSSEQASLHSLRTGFTLIELLVVITIIALLLSILMPSLRRAKEAGKRAMCLHNIRNLTIGWIIYAEDCDGRLPIAAVGYKGTGLGYGDWEWIGYADVLGRAGPPATVDEKLQALKDGVLYPYLDTTDIFRCPIAEKDEMRTYSMTHAMNGLADYSANYGGKSLTKASQITSSSGRIVFLDDYEFNDDAAWFIYNDRPQWWNPTPIRHGSGGNVFSFADGHSEFKKWTDKRTIELSKLCHSLKDADARLYSESIQPGNEDIVWVQKGVWGKLGY
jgi:prepilin-type N-terminal cleavage/methylation domain-containing protein